MLSCSLAYALHIYGIYIFTRTSHSREKDWVKLFANQTELNRHQSISISSVEMIATSRGSHRHLYEEDATWRRGPMNRTLGGNAKIARFCWFLTSMEVLFFLPIWLSVQISYCNFNRQYQASNRLLFYPQNVRVKSVTSRTHVADYITLSILKVRKGIMDAVRVTKGERHVLWRYRSYSVHGLLKSKQNRTLIT